MTERIRCWVMDGSITNLFPVLDKLQLVLTQHFGFWSYYGDTPKGLEMFPISDERVVCTSGRTAIILHTIKTDLVSIPLFGMNLLACNSDPVIHMRNRHTLLWEKILPEFFSELARLFSPNDEFLVIWGKSLQPGVYVLDPSSGKLLHILQTGGGASVCKFVSEVDCVVLSFLPCGDDSCFRLFNIRSGDLLSLIDLETWPRLIASCPGKGFIACALRKSEDLFKIIQTRLSGSNRHLKRSLRSVILALIFYLFSLISL